MVGDSKINGIEYLRSNNTYFIKQFINIIIYKVIILTHNTHFQKSINFFGIFSREMYSNIQILNILVVSYLLSPFFFYFYCVSTSGF